MRSIRKPLLAVVFALVVTLVVANAGVNANAQAADRDQYLANINALRASLGLNPLQLDPELTALAQNWAEHMAATETLQHPPNIAVGVTTPWLELGDNMALGSTLELTWDALVASPVHYYNLTHATFTHVGIGVAWSASGVQYTHEWFKTAPAEAPEPEPELPPPPPPEPEPEPEPVAGVLGVAELPSVNLAVIPLIEYGQVAGVVDASPQAPTSSPLPAWLFATIVAALLLVLGALGLWHHQRRRVVS